MKLRRPTWPALRALHSWIAVIPLLLLLLRDAHCTPRDAHPVELAQIVSNFKMPIVEFDETPLNDALQFVLEGWLNVDWVEGPDYTYRIDVRLPDDVAAKKVSFSGTRLSVGEIVMRITEGLDIRIGLEPGLLIVEQVPTKIPAL
jgi:hypothetical protein